MFSGGAPPSPLYYGHPERCVMSTTCYSVADKARRRQRSKNMRSNARGDSAAGPDGTANDEAIARALAQAEPPPPRLGARSRRDCAGSHGLESFVAANAQRVTCDVCRRRVPAGQPVWSCVPCNFDACERCYRGDDNDAWSAPSSASAPAHRSARARTNAGMPPSSRSSPRLQHNDPFGGSHTPFSHMCIGEFGLV